MFLPYDPFGYDQLVYTVKNQCLEVPEMPYEDGATTIYYYLNGSKGNISKGMKQLFAFMQESTKEKATNEKLEELYDMVATVKKDEEVGLGYMKVYEREQLLIREGQRMEQEKTEKEKLRADRAESKVEEEKARAEEEKARAERAENRVEEEKKRSDRLQSELEELRRKLGQV